MATTKVGKGLTLADLQKQANEQARKNASFNTTKGLKDGSYKFIRFDESENDFFIAVFADASGNEVEISLWECQKALSADGKTTKGLWKFDFDTLSNDLFTDKVVEESSKGKWELKFVTLKLKSRKGGTYDHLCVIATQKKSAH